MTNTFYTFKINSLQGKEIDFADFKNRVVLIVNTASKCGFTPQYTGLQELHEKYKDRGLVVIGFPCNQFGGQEPGDAKEIEGECLVNYGVTFIITEKVDVNGENENEIFKFLKHSLPGILGSEDVKWNFTKFLVDKNGNPAKRYAPTVEPKDMEGDIEELLAK
jgi:glutathione peroxidase